MRIRIQTPLDPEDASKRVDLSDQEKERIMLLVGNAVLSVISLKTARGIDADGKQFAPYTPRYAAQKAKKGRNIGSQGDWMIMSGGMMGDLQIVEHNKDRVIIGFSNPHQGVKAYAHTREGVGKSKTVRNFMGLYVVLNILDVSV